MFLGGTSAPPITSNYFYPWGSRQLPSYFFSKHQRTPSIQSTKKNPGRDFFRIRKNHRNLRMPQSRGFGRPRRSRSQHSNPAGTRCLSSASVAQMLAASIKVMDALFGFLARNDAECSKRELLGRSWRRDWGMHKFRPKNAFLGDRKKNCGLDALGIYIYMHARRQTRDHTFF